MTDTDNPGRALRRALEDHLTNPTAHSNHTLLVLLETINWDAVEFTLGALAMGQEVFASFPSSPILTRFGSPHVHDKPFAF